MHQHFVEIFAGYRSSRPEVFCKKDVLQNFAKFTGKHLCLSLFFNKVADLRPAILLKKRLWHRCFVVNFAKFLRTPFFIEYLWWLLLWIMVRVPKTVRIRPTVKECNYLQHHLLLTWISYPPDLFNYTIAQFWRLQEKVVACY